MDYKEKYKNVMEVLKKAASDPECEDERFCCVVYDLFPELKESEDEKVRKALIAYCQVNMGHTWHDIKQEDYISWLEKQGEQKEYTFKSIPRLLDMIEPSDRAKAYCQKLIDTLAKEGYNTDAKIVEGVLKGWNGEDVPMAVMDEKQGEQKPSTEVKPKFHEGDWIVDNIGVAHQIEKTVLNVTNNTFGYDIVGGGYFNDDSNVHLWTIQDANDGDMLVASDDSIFIYAGSTDRHAQFYIALSKYGGFNTKGGNWEDKNRIKPATKEQRDTLIKAMTDAGYTFDFEKKELKKISQRMVSAEAKEALYDKPAWSEDDEKRLQSCINILKAKSLMGKVDTANTMWLKSLKQRIGG